MDYIFRPEAEDELDQQIAYYENKCSGLGIEFLDEIIIGIGQIIDHPEAWSPAYKDCRKYLIGRFPFKLIYKYYEATSQVLIVAIAHTKREPGYWKGRM
jgi:plasmid stabilization system protein ParE